MTSIVVAGIQMTLAHGDNIDEIERRIEILMHLYPAVEMVVLSELSAFGPLHSYAKKLPGDEEQRFQKMARKHGIWLVAGSLFEKTDAGIYNTCPVINPEGIVVTRHRKLFPFRPFESGVEDGDQFVVFDVPGVGRFGVCICYDMWFPEVPRTLTAMGAEVILHPVLTGTNDRDIELNMARAFGAIFQSYIVDINGLGVGGVGQSCIIDPAGRVVHQAGTTDEFLVAELDINSVRRQREAGLRSLGQPLKSFRDSSVEFAVYHRRKWRDDYLHSLGPLRTPQRQDKGLLAPDPTLNGPIKPLKAKKRR